jgi:hypothetical protein
MQRLESLAVTLEMVYRVNQAEVVRTIPRVVVTVVSADAGFVGEAA